MSFLIHFSWSNITPDQEHAKYFEFSNLLVDSKSIPISQTIKQQPFFLSFKDFLDSEYSCLDLDFDT